MLTEEVLKNGSKLSNNEKFNLLYLTQKKQILNTNLSYNRFQKIAALIFVILHLLIQKNKILQYKKQKKLK